MGQPDSVNAGIHFLMTNLGGTESLIQNSAIYNCRGICFSALNAIGFTITNNVFYNGWRFLISNLDYSASIITNNLLMACRKRIVNEK